MERSRPAMNLVVISLAAVVGLFFVLPLTGLLIRTPWSGVGGIITSRTSLDALRLSLIASLATTALALVFGFPLAWLLPAVSSAARRCCAGCAPGRWCCRRSWAASRCCSPMAAAG
jgi:ABC-type sulfate transport system permease component